MSDLTRAIARQRTLGLLLWLAIAGLLAWFGERLDRQWDLTAAGRHTLSRESFTQLSALDPPPSFTLYARPGTPRDKAERLLRRYVEARPGVTLTLVDPDLEPARTRAAEVAFNGELQIAWNGRVERLEQVDETRLLNALQRLHLGQSRPLYALSGHGERAIDGRANHDLGLFSAALAKRGLHLQPLNLVEQSPEPDALLLIAGPERDLLPGETARLLAHIEQGGSLLWLLDPGPLHGLDPLAAALGLQLPGGDLIDPRAAALGIERPKVAVVSHYAAQPPVAGLEQIALLIDARPLLAHAPEGWRVETLFDSGAESRLQLGDDSESAMPGPFPLGLALTRTTPTGEQRVVVLGDGDLLANAYLGNQGNQALGEALVGWLASHTVAPLQLAPRRAPDLQLDLSPATQATLGLLYLVLLPAGLALGGLWRWRRRQRV